MKGWLGASAAVAGLGIVFLGAHATSPVSSIAQRPASPLVVHEWGTITTLHGPTGIPEGRLNRVATYYDVLPDFVHRYEPSGVATLVKSAVTDGRPDITMRLETPVIYFHPGPTAPAPFDVSVDFRGGVLNEFYPDAHAFTNDWNGKHLSDSVLGSLRWTGITLSDNAKVPPTDRRVWLAPRNVRASSVTTARGESERYIFYRGMANLDAVVRTELTTKGVRVRPPREPKWLDKSSVPLGQLWFVDVRPNHTLAFHVNGPATLTRGDTTPLALLTGFAQSEYSAGALDLLRESMRKALVARGLYDDEAAALLETWKASYFINPGLRIFYLVPDEWTSYYLPLKISTPHTLTRVIVGRIDLPTAAWP